MKPVDIAKPLQIHHRFLTYTLTTRHGSNDEAFSKALNEFDFPPAEIFFHGLHALYRMVKMIREPDLIFREISMPRKDNLSITEELMHLYDETISGFVSQLEKMDEEHIEKEITSPLTGKPIKRKDWFAQCVMHTLHHTGQGIRIQGMVDRKLTGHPVSYDTASDYTPLF